MHKNKALEYLSYGLNPVPVKKGDKAPLRKKHSQTRISEEEIEDFDWDYIGVSTGSVSQGLEVLDFDLKNAEDPDGVLKQFKSKVSNKLLTKLVTQRTQSGGYHLIYRCEVIEGSRKLAYSGTGDEAVIETRGEGGFIVCAPTQGYSLVKGDFSKIPIISPEERLELFVSARMLNKKIQEEVEKKRGKVSEYHDKFPKYDNDVAIGLELLEAHGWTIHSEDEDWINLTRPEKTTGISAGYHKEGKFLFVFSTSTVFETEKPYNNHAIFAELECEGKYNVAYAKLYEEGYGVGEFKEEEEDWKLILDNMAFISTEEEEEDYLEQARKDEIELGLITGWPAVDEYHRIKNNSVNMGLAYEGVGKSVWMNNMAVASNVLHGMKWGMVVPENKTALTRRRLMEVRTGRQIKDFKGSKALFEKYKKETYDNFKIVANRKHYSLKEAIEMGIRMYEYYGIDCLLLDPWNFFRVDGNGYTWNNEVLSLLRVFADKYCSVYVMAHPASDSPRKNLDEHGFLKAPSAYSIQGGADFPYRVDDFFVLHRIKNHPDVDIRRTMQFIMHKVKEEETGGKVHDKGDYTELVYERRHDFLGYWDKDGNNPMYQALYPEGRERAGIGNFIENFAEATPFD